jgi:hypothetical protein
MGAHHLFNWRSIGYTTYPASTREIPSSLSGVQLHDGQRKIPANANEPSKAKKCVQLGSTRYSNAEDLNKVYSLESINSTLKRNNHDFLSNDNLETIEKNTPM